MISGTIAGRQSVAASLAAVQVLHGTVHGNGVIAGAIVNEREVSGVICVEQLARGTLGIPRVIGGDVYDGPCEVTPTRETQTLQTGGKTVLQNITVAPIPQNYGLITWDGSILTVS